VRDAGEGVAPADAERIFLPFERGARAPGAAGLGLTVCRRAIESHGGRIEAVPGHGGTFRITLPRVRKEQGS
jgi:signal transduction histidine kinase